MRLSPSLHLYHVYHGIWLYFDGRSKMITSRSLLTTSFEVNSIFWGSCCKSKYWLDPKIKPSNEVKLVKISDTHGMILCKSLNQKIDENDLWRHLYSYDVTPPEFFSDVMNLFFSSDTTMKLIWKVKKKKKERNFIIQKADLIDGIGRKRVRERESYRKDKK